MCRSALCSSNIVLRALFCFSSDELPSLLLCLRGNFQKPGAFSSSLQIEDVWLDKLIRTPDN